MLAAAPSPRRPDIGLTPLIDVVFILLIFFMLVVQFSHYQQVPLSVLAARGDAQELELTDRSVVGVQSHSRCTVGTTPTACSDVPAALAGADAVTLTYAKEATLGAIIAMQARLRTAALEVRLAYSPPGSVDAGEPGL